MPSPAEAVLQAFFLLALALILAALLAFVAFAGFLAVDATRNALRRR